MRINSRKILRCTAALFVSLCMLALVFRGDVLLHQYLWNESIIVKRDVKVSLPGITVGPNDKLRVCARIGQVESGCQLDETSPEYSGITNWLGCSHNDAMPSLADFGSDYTIYVEGPDPSAKSILISIIADSLIVYDLEENGVCQEYIRTASIHDTRLLLSLHKIASLMEKAK